MFVCGSIVSCHPSGPTGGREGGFDPVQEPKRLLSRPVVSFDMTQTVHRSQLTSWLPSRVSSVAALFVSWGAFKLLTAGLNVGSSTPFYTEWFAILGGLLIVSGVLLYRHHRFCVPIGLLCLGVASSSNIYQLVVYSTPSGSLAVMIGSKLALAYVLVTQPAPEALHGRP